MFEGQHCQIAYVTRDIDATLARFKAPAEVRLDWQIQIPIVTRTGAGGSATADCRLAFA